MSQAFGLRRSSSGGLERLPRATRLAPPVALRETDAWPQIIARNRRQTPNYYIPGRYQLESSENIHHELPRDWLDKTHIRSWRTSLRDNDIITHNNHICWLLNQTSPCSGSVCKAQVRIRISLGWGQGARRGQGALTLLGLQPRLGNKPDRLQVFCPQNVTAVLFIKKGLIQSSDGKRIVSLGFNLLLLSVSYPTSRLHGVHTVLFQVLIAWRHVRRCQ